MAKQIFQDNQLGPEFTQKVLAEVMAEGRQHLYSNEWDEAEASFLKTIGIKPDHAEAHFHVGFVKENQESYEEAAEWYQKAAELKPDYAQAYYNLATSLNCLGKGDESQAACDKAIESCKKLLELNPDDPELYEQLGELYAQKGDGKNGIAALKHAIALKPDYVVAYVYLAHVYQMEGNIEEAKKLYKQATEIKIDSVGRVYGGFGANAIVMAYNNLGVIYDEEGDHDQALFYHQKALEKSRELGETGDLHQTNIAVVYANKGADMAKKGRYSESIETYRKAIQKFDELHRYLKNRLANGEHLEIIDAFEDFVFQNSEDAEAYYCLACLYSAKGDDVKASETLDQAIKLDSSYRQKAKVSKFFQT